MGGMNAIKQEFPNSMGNELRRNDSNGMTNSSGNAGLGIRRDDGGSGIGEYNLNRFSGLEGNDQNESEAILQIRKSMQEEVKKFERDSDSDYFMQ